MAAQQQSPLWSNARQIAQLSGPIVVAQLGTIVTGYADTAMLGHYSTPALAASSFVTTIFNLVILLSLGFSYGITPIVGALVSQRLHRQAGAQLRQALVANALWGGMLLAATALLYCFLHRLGQPPELLPAIRSYYRIIWLSMIPVVVTHVYRQYCDATGHTSLAMWVFMAGNVLNIAGNFVLIYGHCGMPAMGLDGAGWATLAARAFMAVAYVLVVATSARYRDHWRGCLASAASRQQVAAMTRTSLPVALQMGMETGLFTASGIVVGWLGVTELASYQILLMLGNLGFMVYYAIGAGMAIRISHLAGVRDVQGIRQAARAGYGLILACTVLACTVFLLAGHWIASAFTRDDAVIALAVSLIPVLALYQLGDATQVAFANALRGISRVGAMVKIAAVSYLVVGLPLLYLLAVTCGLGLTGVYLCFFVALLLAGILFWRGFSRGLQA